jgi:hypothetical protein
MRFEPTIQAIARLQTYALDRAASGIGIFERAWRKLLPAPPLVLQISLCCLPLGSNDSFSRLMLYVEHYLFTLSVTSSSAVLTSAGWGMSVTWECSCWRQTFLFCISETQLGMTAHELIIEIFSSRLVFIVKSTKTVVSPLLTEATISVYFLYVTDVMRLSFLGTCSKICVT